MLTQTFIRIGSYLQNNNRTDLQMDSVPFKLAKVWSYLLIINNLWLAFSLWHKAKHQSQIFQKLILNPYDLLKYFVLLIISIILIGATFVFNIIAHGSFSSSYLITTTIIASITTLCIHQLFYYFFSASIEQRLKLYQHLATIDINLWLALIKRNVQIIITNPHYRKLTMEHFQIKINYKHEQYLFMENWKYHWWLLIPILNYPLMIMQQIKINQQANNHLKLHLCWLPLLINGLICCLSCLILSCWTASFVLYNFDNSSLDNVVIIIVMIVLMLIINDYAIYYYVNGVENIFSYYLDTKNYLIIKPIDRK